MRKNGVLTVVMTALACAAVLAACGGKKDSGGSGAASGDVAQAAENVVEAVEAVVKAAANPATDFQYDLSEDGKGVVIKKFLRDSANAVRDEAVIIPAEIEGLPVVAIGRRAFQGEDSDGRWQQGYFLASVVIPAGVKKIEVWAFYQCKNLRSVTIQGTGVAIQYAAFATCEKLSELQIPEGDKVLVPGDYTFSDGETVDGKTGFSRCEALPLATRAKLKEMGFNI